MRRHLIPLTTFVLLALALAGCGGSSGHTLTGTVELVYPPSSLKSLRSGIIGHAQDFAEGASCKASKYADGYDDLDPGASVVVKNEKDTVVASGRLGPGQFTATGCETPFTVSKVPAASFYSVEVGHRGAQRYSRTEMDAAKWAVDLSITATA
jgi:hypothetical protein